MRVYAKRGPWNVELFIPDLGQKIQIKPALAENDAAVCDTDRRLQDHWRVVNSTVQVDHLTLGPEKSVLGCLGGERTSHDLPRVIQPESLTGESTQSSQIGGSPVFPQERAST